jgi:hypothetical protein
MENLTNRVIATMLFWMLAGLALGVAIAHPESPADGKFVFFAVVAWIAAFSVTMRVWRTEASSIGHKVKAKRAGHQHEDARLALLLDLLDADEQDLLKRRLIDDLRADGEAVALADLLESDARHYSS